MGLEFVSEIISERGSTPGRRLLQPIFSICTNFLLQALLCVQPNHPVLVLKLGDSREVKENRAGFQLSLFGIKSIKKSKIAQKWSLEVIKKQRKGRDLC